MTTIQVTALDSFVHGTHHVHKHAQLALPESMARDLIKAGLLREGHAVAAAVAPVAPVAAPVAKPERGKRAPANKAVAPQDNKAAADQAGEGESVPADAPSGGPAAAGDAPADPADTAAA